MKIFGRLIGTPTQLSCHQVGKVLQTYLDGELHRDTAAKVRAHLDDCRRCGLEADTYLALMESLRRGPSGLDDARMPRLRAFGDRLARGDLDPADLGPDDLPAL